MTAIFPLFARDILRPEVSAALESLTRPPRSVIEESLHEVFPNYSTLLKQDESYDSDENVFRMFMNVSQFKPEDINVKLVSDELVVHCKHDLKLDQHGYVSREFTRRFKVPDDVEKSNIKCIFNKNGLLTIKAPKKVSVSASDFGVAIPVQVQKSLEAASELGGMAEQSDEAAEKASTGTEYIVRHMS